MSVAVIRQYSLLLKLSLSTLPQRRGAALTIVIATACVVGVLVSMLAATAGVIDADYSWHIAVIVESILKTPVRFVSVLPRNFSDRQVR